MKVFRFFLLFIILILITSCISPFLVNPNEETSNVMYQILFAPFMILTVMG